MTTNGKSKIGNGKTWVVEALHGKFWYAGEYPLDWQYTRNLEDATRYNRGDALEQANWLNSEPRSAQRWKIEMRPITTK